MATRLMTTMFFVFRYYKRDGLLSDKNHRRDEISSTAPSSDSQGLRKRFNGILSQKIDWESMRKICKKWIKNPLNMALLLWISCVAVSGAILFLVMTGMLNHVLPAQSQRNAWFEINNQIINALFTLMSLYHHPKRIHHLVLLLRWKPKDVTFLRKIYCKNGTYKPHERMHILVVVAFLHLNCFAQYALCTLNLRYKRSERPAIGVGICLSVAIAAPAIAGVYCIVSPLGKEYEVDSESQDHISPLGKEYEVDSESQDHILTNQTRKFSFASRNEQGIAEFAPQWRGGLFDFREDIAISYLSFFCTFCVFGWNAKRLGFGNMYVHIATFLLFCTAPFWILSLAAFHIDNGVAREAMTLTGIVLCMFGLLYGGFWRIQMRRRFNLPANNLCCGKPAVTDCAQWLFCCWCSLAQEVRTANFYCIMEDNLCRKHMSEHENPSLVPLRRESGKTQYRSGSNYLPSSRVEKDYPNVDRQLPMEPPVPSRIQREEKIELKT